MRYTIEGFQQEKLVQFGMDSNDALILRWFIDFYATNKMVILRDEAGKEFRWVNYKAIIQDLPIMGINNKEVIARRLQKMVKVGILVHWTCRKRGVYSCYNIGKNCSCLFERTETKEEMTLPTQK